MIKVRGALGESNFEELCNDMYEEGYKLISFVCISKEVCRRHFVGTFELITTNA